MIIRDVFVFKGYVFLSFLVQFNVSKGYESTEVLSCGLCS